MQDNTKQTNSPPDIQSKSRSRDGGAFTVTRAVRLARVFMLLAFVAFGLLYVADEGLSQSEQGRERSDRRETSFDAQISSNAQRMLEEGRRIFRFDTFGDEIFWGDKLAGVNLHTQCAQCHVPPLFTEPGWNAHKPADIGIDDFQSNRSPDKTYRTAPLRGLFTHMKGGFYHDGRFATLLDVVNHYDNFKRLNLSEQEKRELVEYLKSL